MNDWLRNWLNASIGRTPPLREPKAPEPETEWSRQWKMLRAVLAALIAIGLVGGGVWYLLANRAPGKDWAIIVVSGDWHAHDGGPTEAFDNARRDVSAALVSIGFPKDNIQQYSSRPDTHPGALSAETRLIGQGLVGLADLHKDGCLLYFSSHGAPQGVLIGGVIAGPGDMAKFVGGACGDRPTVVVVSACYSGVFVPALAGPNRMIMTAARPDRTSFGCGQDNKYPYFDTCVLETIHAVHSFPELADKVVDCVSRKEQETDMSPPSEPQVFIGKQIAAKLPRW